MGKEKGEEKKIRTTLTFDEEVWKKFLDWVYKKNGRTHGGIISKEVQEALIRCITGKNP